MTLLERDQANIEKGMEKGVERGDAQRLLVAVGGIINHYHTSLADACAVSGCTVDEYYRAKALLEQNEKINTLIK